MLTTSFYDESMPKYKHFSIQPGNKPIKMHSEPFWFVQISKQNQTDVQISSVFSFISYVKYNHKNVSPLQHSLLKEKAFKIKILQWVSELSTKCPSYLIHLTQENIIQLGRSLVVRKTRTWRSQHAQGENNSLHLQSKVLCNWSQDQRCNLPNK